MRPKVQVAFDSRDPELLASFYAKALDYRLQEPPKPYASWDEAQKAWGIPEEDWHIWAAIVDPDPQVAGCYPTGRFRGER